MKVYKTIKVRDLHDENPIHLFEALLNDHADEGWELHSLVPQIYEGSVDNNVAIFVRDSED
ncbi:DUF4177 domain-containing protein [Priestia megaterium]|uniref:DUF4177 domain-containing protein n=1 Tax=Priestia megaterium TaxID=1404 RepID=UPI0035A9064E